MDNFKRLFFLTLFLIFSQLTLASEFQRPLSNAVEPINFVEMSSKIKNYLDNYFRIDLPSSELSRYQSLFNDNILKKLTEKDVGKTQLVRTYASI
ncbi:hypothetical protein [Candidatus Phycorickettsia trachydisci]|nr:hypothetical protein [Candidatus Phycorickettsia trachydisci]